MQARDYLVRLIERAFAALRRALDKLEEGKPAEALTAVAEGYDALPGVDRAMLDALDTPTLVSVLADLQIVRAVARLRAAEAEIWAAQGDERTARRLAEHAVALYGSVGPGDDIDDVATVRRLLTWLQAPER